MDSSSLQNWVVRRIELLNLDISLSQVLVYKYAYLKMWNKTRTSRLNALVSLYPSKDDTWERFRLFPMGSLKCINKW
jgi:hypothetical protein